MLRRPSSIRDELLRPPVEYNPPRRKDNLFLWTVFLLLLVGFSMACWIGSYVVFSRPELPLCYRLLRKIKKIEEPKRFAVNAAPTGEFLGPERLYARYNALSVPELRELNRSLERAYLRNYPTNNELVPYVTGRFTIMESYELHDTDFVPSGVVAVAVSSDFPKVLIEHIYSASAQTAPVIRRNLQTGRDIELRRTFELTAVLHVNKLPDGRLVLSVMPINYGRYEFTGSNGGFELQPPATLNVAAGWPIVRGDRLEAATQAYVDYRTRSGSGSLAGRPADAQKTTQPALKGVDVPVESAPPLANASPTPANPVGTSLASANVPAEAKGLPSPVGTPTLAESGRSNVTVLPALPVNPPLHPPGRPAQTPAVALKAVPPNPLGTGVALQPFLGGSGSSASLPPTNASGSAPHAAWTMYSPGQMPSGKDVRVNDIAALNQHGPLGSEPVYLTGQFVVRVTGEDRMKGVKNAILRSSKDSNVRVIVQYPADHALPPEGAELIRDSQHPYQIMDVRRGDDGTLNVTAREITGP